MTNRNPRESTRGQKTIFGLALSVTTPDDMVGNVKTTIDIDESLLTRAKQVAATEGVTLRELVEDGLRHTWLAWQEEPGKPVGLAFTAQYLDPTVARVDVLVPWLNRLYFQ